MEFVTAHKNVVFTERGFTTGLIYVKMRDQMKFAFL